ncbi:DNA repair protein RecO C-terminal domain-containing protein [Candidatus Peregrinibacteria bacterium]|nr:MAG: DNA repair protein RecO C-terminal domain-containing protein [Candidatus Peregrinibacteria bacterium]
MVQRLGLIGFTSPWQHCAICHDRLSGDGDFWMSDEHLNVVCTHCKQPADEPVPLDLVKWVAFIQANPLAHSLTIRPNDVQFQQIWNWLQRTLNQLLSSEVKSGAFLGFSKM